MMSSMAQFRDNRMGSSHYVSSDLSPVKEGHKASIIGTEIDTYTELSCLLDRTSFKKRIAAFANTTGS
jgi:hypothetical protein